MEASQIKTVVITPIPSILSTSTHYQARLYAHGVPCQTWTGKTLLGAKRWANRVLKGGAA